MDNELRFFWRDVVPVFLSFFLFFFFSFQFSRIYCKLRWELLIVRRHAFWTCLLNALVGGYRCWFLLVEARVKQVLLENNLIFVSNFIAQMEQNPIT